MYQYKGDVIRIVDGDTYDIEVDLGFNTFKVERFRLIGIDTPETWRPKTEEERIHGERAAEFAKNAIDDRKVIITTSKSSAGIYGRYECSIELHDGSDLATELRENGFTKRESYGE